jgi:alpha-1,2-glucosyltransferase
VGVRVRGRGGIDGLDWTEICGIETVIGRTHSLAWLMAFGVCTGAVLVPTPLVEPRYFLVPYLIIRLECAGRAKANQKGEGPSDRWLLVELGWNTLINVVTLYVFLTVKFEWVGWEGWMRFMW